MSSDELRVWLLLAGFKSEFSRFFYLGSGFDKMVITTVLIDGAIEVRSLVGERLRVFMDCAEAQEYIQELIK